MDKIKAKVEQVLHKDTTHSNTTGTHTATGAPHGSHTANTVDPTVSTGHHTGTTGTHTGTHTGQTSGLTGTTGSSGYSDPTGPHDSKLANKLDPRVDSDKIGAYGNTTGAGGYGTTGTHSSGLTGGSHTTGSGYSDPSGPHDTRTANVLDPRVDSSHAGGYGNTSGAGGYGTTGTHTGHSSGLTGNTHSTGTGFGSSGTHSTGTGYSDPTGPHDSRLGNKVDPRVDSDRVGTSGNMTGIHPTGHHLPGPAPTTAGPHGSDMLNKLDPRVDSDLDHSKTVGGDRTYN